MFLFKYYGLKEICYRIDNFQNCECQKKKIKKNEKRKCNHK